MYLRLDFYFRWEPLIQLFDRCDPRVQLASQLIQKLRAEARLLPESLLERLNLVHLLPSLLDQPFVIRLLLLRLLVLTIVFQGVFAHLRDFELLLKDLSGCCSGLIFQNKIVFVLIWPLSYYSIANVKLFS